MSPWTGPLDYASSKEAIWLNYELEPVRESSKKLEKYSHMMNFTKYFDGYDSDTRYMWAKPDMSCIVKAIRNVHCDNYDKKITDRALKKAQTFSWDKVAKNMIEVIEQHG